MSLQYGNINNLMYSNNFKNTIIAYYGDTPPHGWVLCDGRIVNGKQTPDLRNKFIMGGDNISQQILQNYLKNLNIDKTDVDDIDVLQELNKLYEYNNVITDSTREIQGGKNFVNKTSNIFNKEILKYDLLNVKNILQSRNEDPDIIEEIKSLVNTITPLYNNIIDDSTDINNSHIFDNNVESNNVDITSITNIQPIIDSIPDIAQTPNQENLENLETLIDIDNTGKYQEITSTTAPIDPTAQQPAIVDNEYKTWLNSKLGDNSFTDDEFTSLWSGFTQEGYNNNYIDSFSLSKFIGYLNNLGSIDDTLKHKLIVKLYVAYNPTTFTKITNRENVYTEYGNYKYPSSKQLTADNNLPPYYSLIYIMKL